MRKQRLWKMGLAGAAVCLLSVTLAAPTQSQQEGLGERLGERLDQGISQLSEEVQQGWASLRQTVDRMGVQGRVYSRLRWDKEIATAEIDVEVAEEGVVALRGEVKNPQAKRKAVELAKSTVGVQRVIDELSIQPATGNPAEAPAR